MTAFDRMECDSVTTMTAVRKPPMTLEQWVRWTAEGTEDPYSHLDRDAEDREAIEDLLGRRES